MLYDLPIVCEIRDFHSTDYEHFILAYLTETASHPKRE